MSIRSLSPEARRVVVAALAAAALKVILAATTGGTDDIPQLEHYRGIGYFQAIPPIHASLGELVIGQKPGRESASERTMACNLGLALDDMATAPLVLHNAKARGLGTWLDL